MIQRAVTAVTRQVNLNTANAPRQRTARGVATLAGLGLLLGALPGCQSITGSPLGRAGAAD